MIEYVREKLEEIPLRDLSGILNGILFVFCWQRDILEVSINQLKKDLNGDNLFDELREREKSRKRAEEGA